MYGCGASTCKECQPFTYRCAECDHEYPTPVPNGEKEACTKCGFTYDPKTGEVDFIEVEEN